jgi:hypothetical protein
VCESGALQPRQGCMVVSDRGAVALSVMVTEEIAEGGET